MPSSLVVGKIKFNGAVIMWNNPTIILGDEPTAEALQRTLALLGITASKYPSIPKKPKTKESHPEVPVKTSLLGQIQNRIGALLKNDLASLPEELDAKNYESFQEVIKSPGLVIMIASQPAKIISCVSHLRSGLKWAGKFLAIVRNCEQAQELIDSSLFGDSQDKLRYGKLPGHGIVCQPLQITQLLQVIDEIVFMGYSKWNVYRRESWLGQFCLDVDKAEDLLTKGDSDSAKEALAIISKRLNSPELEVINWHTQLPSHEDARWVRSQLEIIKNRYSHSLSEDNVCQVIQELKQICQRIKR